MRKHTRILLLGVSALIALGTLTACSGSSSNEAASRSSAAPAPTTSAVTPFPASARYIADMPAPGGRTMTIGIAVEGNDIAAYACNGVDDEAWFFGTQNTGSIDITGKFRDTLKASFDGKDVVGDLTMNGVPFRFTAAKVPDPAGMYTAELDGVRSSWVVRPDGSATGVQITGAASTLDQADIERLKDQQFRDEVRNKRKLQQAAQLTRLQNGAFTSTINDKPVTPVLVTGTFRL